MHCTLLHYTDRVEFSLTRAAANARGAVCIFDVWVRLIPARLRIVYCRFWTVRNTHTIQNKITACLQCNNQIIKFNEDSLFYLIMTS